MLWDVIKNKEITQIPHKKEFEIYKKHLTTDQIAAIKKEIRRLILEGGDEVATAGWLPGKDWAPTPFWAIYKTACCLDREASGKCFGLFVWEALMEHEDYWGFGKYEVHNIPIESMTYFKVHPKG